MSEQHLSPKECGKLLKVTSEFIRGEIKDGRLVARRRTMSSGRTMYRIDPIDFAAYVDQHWSKNHAE